MMTPHRRPRFDTMRSRHPQRRLAHGLCAAAFLMMSSALYPTLSAANAEPLPAKSVSLSYAGSALGLRLVEATLSADVEDGAYVAQANFRSVGLLRFFEASTVEAASGGLVDTDGLTPFSYAHDDQGDSKRRLVTFDYGPDDVQVHVTPPFGSLGEPPASPAQKREALDPVSAVLALAVNGGETPCDRTVPVFDSRLRYNLVLTSEGRETVTTRAYTGEAMRCTVRYVPIAGFDPDDLEDGEAYETPVSMWLAPLAGGVTAPVLIKATFGSTFPKLDVRIEALSATVDPSAS